jgi:hypothetical protein
MVQQLNVVFYIQILSHILSIPQVVDFPDSSPSGIRVHFIQYRKDKIRTVRKKSGLLITLLENEYKDHCLLGCSSL